MFKLISDRVQEFISNNPLTNDYKNRWRKKYFGNGVLNYVENEIIDEFKIGYSIDFTYVMNQNSPMGLINTLLDATDKMFSPFDLAVSIKMVVKEMEKVSEYKDCDIRRFAVEYCKRLKELLVEDEKVMKRLDKVGKCISKLDNTIEADTILETLGNMELCCKHYYSQMSSKYESNELTIYYPNEKGYVNYEDEYSISIKVESKFRIGTFLAGYSYRLKKDGVVEDLDVAFEEKGYEYFNGAREVKSPTTFENIVWLK